MALVVREVFATLQGEGSLAGSPAVFVRLSACNLWSGREKDRATSKGGCGDWCDTEFATGDKLSVEDVVQRVWGLSAKWNHCLVVLTGGEPTLQLTKPEGELLVGSLREYARVAIETNGTVKLPSGLRERLSHVTVSPKPLRSAGGDTSHLRQLECTDLKIVVPSPFDLRELIRMYDYEHLFFQPCDVGGDRGAAAFQAARDAAELHGGRVSVQVHKYVGLP